MASSPPQLDAAARYGAPRSDPTDPWASTAPDIERRDNWLLTYIDILTLFLFLVVVLLVYQSREQAAPFDDRAAEVQPLVTSPPATPAQFPEPRPEEPLSMTAAPSMFAHLEESGFAAPLFETEPSPLADTVIALPPPQTSEPAKPMAPLSNTIPPRGDTGKTNTVPGGADALVERLRTGNWVDRLEATAVADGVYLQLRGNILFAPGSDTLLGAGGQLLSELVNVLEGHKDLISVEGHTDDRPIANRRFPSNWELSSARATRVARYLIEHGFHPENLRIVGYADTRPSADNATAAGRAQNRRVTLLVHMGGGAPPEPSLQRGEETEKEAGD